jgi:hypothetical protein
MTVNVVGTMTEDDAAKLRELLDYGDVMSDRFGEVFSEPYACLSYSSHSPGLCGLGAWPAAEMNACGNLAERDFTVEDVAGGLRALVHHAPSMLLKVHCGGDYESDQCVATILAGEGLVAIRPPQQPSVAAAPLEQMIDNLTANLRRG